MSSETGDRGRKTPEPIYPEKVGSPGPYGKNPKVEKSVKRHRTYLRYFRSAFEAVLFLIFVASIFIYTFQSVTNPSTG